MPNWTPIYEAALREMNPGEKSVARKLQEQLPSGVQIIPNYRWQIIDNYKAPVDLETDFLIIWPMRGIVILEVKSGPVGWDSNRNDWTGIISRSPTQQARGSRTDLCARLSKRSHLGESEKVWRDRIQAFPLFPDVERDRFPDVMDGYERVNILGRKELKSIGSTLEHLTSRTEGLSHDLTDERCAGLVKVLCPSVKLNPRITHIIEDESERIEWATTKSLKVIESVGEMRYVFLSGSAGTGKTLHGLTALNKWLHDGQHCFLIAKNPHLILHLQNRFPKLANSIVSITTFLREIVKIKTPCDDPMEEDTLLKVLYQSCSRERLSGISIILDEAQDLSQDSLDGLLALCDYRRFWILYDDQQVLHQGEGVEAFEKRIEESAGLNYEPIRLRYNLRNTQRIGEYAAEWVHTSYAPADDLPIGEAPSITHVRDEAEHDSVLKNLLHSILVDGDYSSKDVVILSCLQQSEVVAKYASSKGERTFGRRMAYIGPSKDQGVIRVSSVLDFKGQEARVIVLVDTREASVLNAFYIGGSRAMHRLFVIAFEKPVDKPSTNRMSSVRKAGFHV